MQMFKEQEKPFKEIYFASKQNMGITIRILNFYSMLLYIIT